MNIDSLKYSFDPVKDLEGNDIRPGSMVVYKMTKRIVEKIDSKTNYLWIFNRHNKIHGNEVICLDPLLNDQALSEARAQYNELTAKYGNRNEEKTVRYCIGAKGLRLKIIRVGSPSTSVSVKRCLEALNAAGCDQWIGPDGAFTTQTPRQFALCNLISRWYDTTGPLRSRLQMSNQISKMELAVNGLEEDPSGEAKAALNWKQHNDSYANLARVWSLTPEEVCLYCPDETGCFWLPNSCYPFYYSKPDQFDADIVKNTSEVIKAAIGLLKQKRG